MLIILLFSGQISGEAKVSEVGGGKLPQGAPPAKESQYITLQDITPNG